MELEKNHMIKPHGNQGIANGLILMIITLLVPGIGIFCSVSYLLVSKGLYYKHERMAYFNIALSLAILAFSIHPGPIPGGDVYRYYLEMNKGYVQDPYLFLVREKNLMNITFYGLMHYIQKFSLPKNVLSFVCIFISYLCTFLTLIEARQRCGSRYSNISAIIIVLFFYVYSPYTLFSNYRTFLAMSIISLGIARTINGNTLSGSTLLVIGTVSHNAGWVITGLFLLSRFVAIPLKLHWLAIVVFFVNDLFIRHVVNLVMKLGYFTNYIQALVSSYVYGRYASFFTSGSYGFVHWGRAALLLIATTMVYTIMIRQGERSSYLRFIGIYLFFLISFFNFRMVVERFTLLGFVLFIPLYWEFLVKNYPKSYKVLFLALMFMNFDVFNFMDYGIRVGIGFPLNLFEPSISLLKNYIIHF